MCFFLLLSCVWAPSFTPLVLLVQGCMASTRARTAHGGDFHCAQMMPVHEEPACACSPHQQPRCKCRALGAESRTCRACCMHTHTHTHMHKHIHTHKPTHVHMRTPLQPPDAQVKMQVKGPLIGEREVPQFSFMRSALVGAIQDTLVEPRRWGVCPEITNYKSLGQGRLGVCTLYDWYLGYSVPPQSGGVTRPRAGSSVVSADRDKRI